MAKNFTAVSGEDWAQTVEVIDDETGGPLTDIDTGLIELQVQDNCGKVVLSGSSEDGTIIKPGESGMFTWRFPWSRVSALPSGQKYKVACRLTVDSAITMLFLEGLVIEEQGFTWR